MSPSPASHHSPWPVGAPRGINPIHHVQTSDVASGALADRVSPSLSITDLSPYFCTIPSMFVRTISSETPIRSPRAVLSNDLNYRGTRPAQPEDIERMVCQKIGTGSGNWAPSRRASPTAIFHAIQGHTDHILPIERILWFALWPLPRVLCTSSATLSNPPRTASI